MSGVPGRFLASDGLVHVVEDADKKRFNFLAVCGRRFYRGGTGAGYNPQPTYVKEEYTSEVPATCISCLSESSTEPTSPTR